MLDRISSTYIQLADKEVRQVEFSDRKTEKRSEQQEKLPQVQSKDDIRKVVSSINEFLKPLNTHLKFEFHEELEEYYATIVDDRTKEVIKEIPSKKVMDMHASMAEYLGLLIDKKI
ncbi:flagellar protein FlaG [Robertmurraya kyonggiensis]|uniref:Flagellar protein FlaG n=1 Tax=Robertmurraya kyonggiensis TaxID=1037680 RepID=A0A4U1D3W7_9BACI|nr:flagellar protein FlaG [Robertmurraya kyonggiensis]TKC17042.1 flagellar protein FlaG [Robertmurraya kyonggiensis]